MKNLTEIISESAEITGLKPYFYFNCMDFFEILTNQEEQKYIKASYKRKDNNHFVYFFYKNKQIGYVSLKPIVV